MREIIKLVEAKKINLFLPDDIERLERSFQGFKLENLVRIVMFSRTDTFIFVFIFRNARSVDMMCAGNFKKAYEFQSKYIILKDSIFNI